MYSYVLLFIATTALALLAFETGLRVGRRRSPQAGAGSDSSVGAIVGATLGLLAFMLAFTFGMAASHFDQRRKLVLEEADAIGTTYLRASLLPTDAAAQARTLLREYVQIRLSVSSADDIGPLLRKSADIHRRLWAGALEVASVEGAAPLIGRLYLPSLNEVISFHGRRASLALRYRIPSVIWFVLYILMSFGMAAVGYQAGLGPSRRILPVLVLTVAFSLVLLLIADLERPVEGFLKGDHQALDDVAAAMAEDLPARAPKP